VAGYVVPGGAGSAGLNLFIPIGDALDRLRLEITER
jgi:serine protease Do